jgi:hypothetical protein
MHFIDFVGVTASFMRQAPLRKAAIEGFGPRLSDGRKRAKARGVRFGRPPALTEAIQRLAEGATQADLAWTYGVSQATISRLQPSPFEAASVAVA